MNLKDFSNMRRRNNYRYLVFSCVLVYTYYFFGVGDYMLAKSFENEFDYPLNTDIKPLVHEVMSGDKASVAPINYYPYRFLTNSGKCSTIEKLDLFIVVKSAIKNFGHRNAIRQTYGQENIVPGRIVKTLFFLGIDESLKSVTQNRIKEEMATHKDIIQIDFHDNYYNNTIKTMMAFRWVYQHCPTADFYLFTDDDMYISIPNLLDYVYDRSEATTGDNSIEQRNKDIQSGDYETPQEKERDNHLFAGFVFDSTPQRFRNSKWRVSLEEYPWNRWPPYVTAGAYVISNTSMKVIYIGSLFVKHFRFDDIYLGIVAKKVGIKPTHCSNFHFYKKPYTKKGYADVIASHGFSDHDELVRVWYEQHGDHVAVHM